MNDFIEFMSKYWFQLVTGLFAIVQIVLIIVKRKPKSIDDFKLALTEASSKVADFVKSVERPGSGYAKKVEVEVLARNFVEKRLGRYLSKDESLLTDELIDKQIETVLSTPTKKEIKNEK